MGLVLSVSSGANVDGVSACAFVLRTEEAAAEALAGTADERIAFGGANLGAVSPEEAQYRGLVWGLRNALAHMASAFETSGVTVRLDSEPVVRQLVGMYQVKDSRLEGLYSEAHSLLEQAGPWVLDSVGRTANPFARELVGLALDTGVACGDYLVAIDGTPVSEEPAPSPARIMAACGPDVIAFRFPSSDPAVFEGAAGEGAVRQGVPAVPVSSATAAGAASLPRLAGPVCEFEVSASLSLLELGAAVAANDLGIVGRTWRFHVCAAAPSDGSWGLAGLREAVQALVAALDGAIPEPDGSVPGGPGPLSAERVAAWLWPFVLSELSRCAPGARLSALRVDDPAGGRAVLRARV